MGHTNIDQEARVGERREGRGGEEKGEGGE